MAYYQYPLGAYATEQPLWINFFCAKYSLINDDRTREGIQSRAFHHLKLPMPKEPGYFVRHEFGEGTNPVGPTITLASIANSGGIANFDTLFQRNLDPGAFQEEYFKATSTFRRFSNITEATLVSEARKEYNFEYIFVPKNQAESEQVEEIVGTFRKCSYPSVATGLPERTYPQNLWSFEISKGANTSMSLGSTDDWLGEPLPCVLTTVVVKKNDSADPVLRLLPNGNSNVVLLGLVFREFETGTYDPSANAVLSKSEISAKYF
jgi:hypothetical protein